MVDRWCTLYDVLTVAVCVVHYIMYSLFGCSRDLRGTLYNVLTDNQRPLRNYIHFITQENQSVNLIDKRKEANRLRLAP